MKKTIIVILGLSLVLAVFGLVSIMGNGSKSNAINTIGTKKAKEIAFTSSGYSESNAREISVEFEKANGRDIYEVEFEINNLDFNYYIDAYTGAIIESKVPTVSAQAEAMANANSKTEINAETHPTEEGHGSTEQSSHNTQPAQNNTQTAPQTSTKPTQNAQNTPAPQQNTPAPQQSTPKSPDTESQATPVNPTQNVSPNTPSGIISESEAKNLVLARVPGASNSNFVKFHLDFDDGRYEYEGELIFNEMEYDFEIDAYSGSFRDWDAESIYD